MLKVDDLKSQLEAGIKTILVPAIERMESMRYPNTSKAGKAKAEEIRNAFNDMVAEPLAEVIANAIDYYIKNASITGTIITVGGPMSQTATISSMPTPITNGKVPNTLGIS